MVGALVGSLIHYQFRETMLAWEQRQSSIADDRSWLVSAWLSERRGDATAFSADSVVLAVLSPANANRPDRDSSRVQRDLKSDLDLIATSHGYSGIYLLDSDGRVAAKSSGADAMDPRIKDICIETAQAGNFRVSTLGDQPSSPLSFSMPVIAKGKPLYPASHRSPLPGCVALVIDPASSLFPFLIKESVPTRSGETVLLRREGNEAVFVSPLRNNPHQSTCLRVALGPRALAGQAALAGQEKFGEFIDYRGVRVLASTRRIPLTGWGLVSKIDRDEALMTFRRTARLEVLAASFLALALALSLAAHRRYLLTRVLKDEGEKFRDLLESAPDAFLIVNREARIMLVNSQTEKMFGWRRVELLGQPISTLIPEWFGDPHSDQYAKYFTGSSAHEKTFGVETNAERKDGTEFPVEVTLGALQNPQGSLIVKIRDITERKRAEAALRESEARFRAVFENAAIGIALVDMYGHPVESNPALQKMLGYSALELAQMTIGEFTFPDDVKPSWDLFMELVEGKRDGYHLDKRFSRKDGQVVWGQLTESLVRNQNGEPNYAIGMVADISERKRAEVALIEEKHLLHTLTDNLPDYIYFKDRQSRFIRVNQALVKSFGLSDAIQVLGKTDFDYFADEHAREFFSDEQEIMRTGQPIVSKEEKVTWPDGCVNWVSTTKMPLRDAQGRIIGTFGVSRDITERKRAEEALRASEEHFRSFVENLPVGVYRTTPDGHVLMANPALLRMLGYDSWQELASRNLEDEGFQAGYPRTAFREQIERQGEVRGLEAAWKRRDGSVVFVRESAKAVRADDGRVLYYDGTLEDITERSRLEEQLRRAHKMEAVGRLAAGVAHDFNNLLTDVIGYSDFLLQRPFAVDGMRPRMAEIKKAGERAASLTRQLLAFSRMQVLQPQIVDLNSLLTNVDEMLRRVIGEDIELVTHLPSGLGHVKADPGQIEQVIMNLVVNARDAMPQGGQLTLEAANVELDSSYANSLESVLPGHYVMLAVSDTGIGINAETRAHIFEPFFTTKEQGKGTGLGLAMVYGIVKQSGGNIWVYSEPGKGTTFKVFLPRVDQPVEAIAPGELRVEELSSGSETILLVEDEEAVRSWASEVLESRGYHVLQTDGAIKALELAEGHKEQIHLLLTDVVMPQMNGKELAELLAPLHPETSVLYMSGYADNAVVHHGLLDPGTALLQKPFTADALARKLREVLDGSGDQKT